MRLYRRVREWVLQQRAAQGKSKNQASQFIHLSLSLLIWPLSACAGHIYVYVYFTKVMCPLCVLQQWEYVWSLPWCVKPGENVLSPRAATRRLRYHTQKQKHRTEVCNDPNLRA